MSSVDSGTCPILVACVLVREVVLGFIMGHVQLCVLSIVGLVSQLNSVVVGHVS